MNDEKDLTVDQIFDLAVRNHQNSNFQDAQNYYEKVLKIDPNHFTALNNLGAIYKSINDYDEIILIGSGKGVTSVSKINDLKWKRRKTGCYTKLNKIYNSLV